MQKPRNPQYFPKMKVRGARRKRLAPFQRMARQIVKLGVAVQETADALNTLKGKL